MALVSKLDSRMNQIQNQSAIINEKVVALENKGNTTEELDKIMEAAKTALTLSLKNKEDISSLKDNDNQIEAEISKIRSELVKMNKNTTNIEK